MHFYLVYLYRYKRGSSIFINNQHNSISSQRYCDNWYSGLQVVSVFDPLEFSYCSWRYLDQTLMRIVELFSPGFIDCEDRDINPNFLLLCAESEGIINSTLTLMFPLQKNFTVSVECTSSIIASYENLISTNVEVASKWS